MPYKPVYNERLRKAKLEPAEFPRPKTTNRIEAKRLLREFLESGMECAIVADIQKLDEETEHEQLQKAYSALNSEASLSQLAVKVTTRAGNLYLVRETPEKETPDAPLAGTLGAMADDPGWEAMQAEIRKQREREDDSDVP